VGERSGANVCRNLGLSEARGEFIVFLDSDDLLTPECLGRRVETMRRNQDLDFAVFRADVFVEDPNKPYGLWHPQTPGDDLNRFLQHECIWDITGPCWRKTAFAKFGVFDESLLSMQDFDLHIRVMAGSAQYIKFPQVDHSIRGHTFDAKTSSRHFRDPEFLLAVRNLPVRFRDILLTNHLLNWTRRRLLAGLVFGNAENWTRIGNLREALSSWKMARDADLAETCLYLLGLVALTMLRIAPKDGGIVQRLVAKWKGWVRFRQEPSLIKKQPKDG
jgi:glycosyltransferase involved in cell wall biosynthesis